MDFNIFSTNSYDFYSGDNLYAVVDDNHSS